MKKLTQTELTTLANLLERANHNEQIGVSVHADSGESFNCQQIVGVCANDDDLELMLKPEGLKWLWVRHTGSLGGKKKAANATTVAP